jgi:hypothetical protein
MTIAEAFMLAVSKRYNFKKLRSDDLARVQELFVQCYQCLARISEKEPNDDLEQSADIITDVIETINRCEEIAAEGKITLINDDTDIN